MRDVCAVDEHARVGRGWRRARSAGPGRRARARRPAGSARRAADRRACRARSSARPATASAFVSSGCSARGAHARLVDGAAARRAEQVHSAGAAPASSAAVKSRTHGSCAVSETMTRSAAGRGGAHLEAPVARRSRPRPRRAASRGAGAARRARMTATSAPTMGSRVPLLADAARARRRARAAGGGRRRRGRVGGAASAGGGVGGRRRRASAGDRSGLEVERELDADRRRLAVDLGRRELHLARRGGGCLVEAVARAGFVTATAVTCPSASRSSDSVTSPDEPAVERLGRVDRLDRAS